MESFLINIFFEMDFIEMLIVDGLEYWEKEVAFVFFNYVDNLIMP